MLWIVWNISLRVMMSTNKESVAKIPRNKVHDTNMKC